MSSRHKDKTHILFLVQALYQGRGQVELSHICDMIKGSESDVGNSDFEV